MAVKRELEFIISSNGEVQLHVKGMKGSECVKLTSELENMLGEVKGKRFTSEYYQTDEEEKGKIKAGDSR